MKHLPMGRSLNQVEHSPFLGIFKFVLYSTNAIKSCILPGWA